MTCTSLGAPAAEAGQQPGHATLVTAAAYGVQQVVAVDEHQFDVGELTVLGLISP